MKIISGGQTGVDRAALDVAIFLNIEQGGWCPKGRRAEDGVIPEAYRLQETESRDYSVRTEQNVVDADGTLILFQTELSGGTKLTKRLAEKHNRPALCIDIEECTKAERLDADAETLRKWLSENNIGVLNVAGPRASSHQGIGKRAEQLLLRVFED